MYRWGPPSACVSVWGWGVLLCAAVCAGCHTDGALLSSADNSTHSADTSNKFVFGQNMSERVLVSGPGAVPSCVPVPTWGTRHAAAALSPAQSGRERPAHVPHGLRLPTEAARGLASPFLSLLSTDLGVPVARASWDEPQLSYSPRATSLRQVVCPCPQEQPRLPLLQDGRPG